MTAPKRILVIDDDEGIRAVLEMALLDEGYGSGTVVRSVSLGLSSQGSVCRRLWLSPCDALVYKV